MLHENLITLKQVAQDGMRVRASAGASSFRREPSLLECLQEATAQVEALKNQVDEDNQRDFYIQNGYEYWPFRGEYWLDELGNYHYVGTQSCN